MADGSLPSCVVLVTPGVATTPASSSRHDKGDGETNYGQEDDGAGTDGEVADKRIRG